MEDILTEREDIDVTELYLENIRKTYRDDSFTLKIDDLKINKGEFFGLLGPSGCGKTTLLKLLAGLIAPDLGKLEVSSENITMVFQQPLLFPHLTIEKNIEFGLKMKKKDKSRRKTLIDKYLRVVGLENFNKRFPGELSGGQMQRVSIARAMVLEPDILLMDEPFSALDPGLRKVMRDLILEIHKDTDMTIVFVTHDIDEAFELFSRVAVLKNGEIIDIGKPYTIYEKPRNIDSAMFLKSSNIINLPHSELIEKPYKEDKNSNDDFSYAVIRPEAVEIDKAEENLEEKDKDESNKIKTLGTVEDIKFKIGFVTYFVRIGQTIIEVVEKKNKRDKLSIGDEVVVKYDREDIHFIE